MTRKRPDYTEARNYYIKGYKNEYPTLVALVLLQINHKELLIY